LLLDFFNADVEISLMLPNSVKMFLEKTTAESDKSINAVTHTGNEICKTLLSFSSLQMKIVNLENLKYGI